VAYELHAAIARYRGEPNVVDRFRGLLVRLRTRVVREWRRLRRTGTDMSETLNVPIVSEVRPSRSMQDGDWPLTLHRM
jgi:hypothetical protein